MKAVQLKENIYWVGGVDWKLRNFHGYTTQRGSSYNAYLILDEKVTLIDTAKYYLADELISRISDVTDPSKIDYVVSLHAEQDHSGSLQRVLELAPKAKLFTCAAGRKDLSLQYNKEWNFNLVNTGDTLSLGEHSLQFVTTPMVHWPDNMVAYDAKSKILFSNDAFGQHISSYERFDDEYPVDIIMEEAQKYYGNIVMPYARQTNNALDATAALDLDMIAPGHGIIWRSHIPAIIEKYRHWANNEYEKKAVIIYDTMWGTTEKMAYKVYEAFEEKGYHTEIFDLKISDNSDIITKVVDAEYICVGSPTLNKGVLANVGGFLTYLKGLTPKNRKGILFGSYGWAPSNIQTMERFFEESDIATVLTFGNQFSMTEEKMQEMKNKIQNIL